jgi:hypothetical protein
LQHSLRDDIFLVAEFSVGEAQPWGRNQTETNLFDFQPKIPLIPPPFEKGGLGGIG